MNNSIENIKQDLLGENTLKCLYAIKSCVKNKVLDDTVIEILKSLKSNTKVEWNSCKVGDCAIASLDLLGIEKYTGNEPSITTLIENCFFI
jgi:hypothetical protein